MGESRRGGREREGRKGLSGSGYIWQGAGDAALGEGGGGGGREWAGAETPGRGMGRKEFEAGARLVLRTLATLGPREDSRTQVLKHLRRFNPNQFLV